MALFRTLFRTLVGSRTHPSKPARANRYVPRLEQLDERIVPSSSPSSGSNLDLSPLYSPPQSVTLQDFPITVQPPTAAVVSFFLAGKRPDAVARGFTHSQELSANQVTNAYRHFLGRTPGAQELAGWVNALQHGMSDEQLEAGFVSSPEYVQSHGGPGAEWVRGLYQDLLGRAGSQAEVNGWVQALRQKMSTAAVADSFAGGVERESDRVQADYQTVLHRAATPAEVQPWVDQMFQQGLSNEDVLANMVVSDEYIGEHGSQYGTTHPLSDLGASGIWYYADLRFGTGDQYLREHGGDSVDWVRGLYQDVLARQADLAGLNSWLRALDSSAMVTAEQGPVISPIPAPQGGASGLAIVPV
jgi:hypothetical protein